MGSSLMDGSPRRDRFIGYGGLRADVVWEGLSGRFDALSDLLSDPVKRSSKFHLEVKPSRCPGSVPPISSASEHRIRRTCCCEPSRRRRLLVFARR